MIFYSNEGIGPFAVSLLGVWRGSVVPKAVLFSLPSVAMVFALRFISDNMPEEDWSSETIQNGQLWNALTSTLAFLLTFRCNKAYQRFWDGTTLLHQMWGEWFDASSCLIAFTSKAIKKDPKAVSDFRHTLIRLVSLLHSSALDEIGQKSDDKDKTYSLLDPAGLDQATLEYLVRCKDDKNLGFNRVEVIIHMIQTLVVDAHPGVLEIPPPILSRVFQTLSRGQVNLANCKKMVTTLYPFPLAQLTAVLLIVLAVLTPFHMAAIIINRYWACIFTGVPVAGLFALNYIARELEMPFGDDPNDLPIDEFQEHMNRSLLMLIREESDHIVKPSTKCMRSYDEVKASTTTDRLYHFVDPQIYHGKRRASTQGMQLTSPAGWDHRQPQEQQQQLSPRPQPQPSPQPSPRPQPPQPPQEEGQAVKDGIAASLPPISSVPEPVSSVMGEQKPQLQEQGQAVKDEIAETSTQCIAQAAAAAASSPTSTEPLPMFSGLEWPNKTAVSRV